MTPREIELLVQAFEAFLGGNEGERFLLTNRSMRDFVQYSARHLRASKSHEAALQHVIDHGAEEREKRLAKALERGDVAKFAGRDMVVLTELSAHEFFSSKAEPDHPWPQTNG
jgi:hypothetical protein